MDLLSAVLSEARFASAGYRWLGLGTPFRIGFDHPGLRGVHLVIRGRCEYQLAGRAEPLGTGDLVIFPRGDAHVLQSPGSDTGPVTPGYELAMRTPGIRPRAGGPSPDTVVMCGAFVVGEPDHPALRGLPAVLRVPGTAGRPQPWLMPLVEALEAEALDGGPGTDLVMARLSDAMLIRALRHHGDTEPAGWLAGLADPYVAAALQALHADPARPWTLAALARVAGLSRAAFAARFTVRVGEPAMRYLLAIRMQRARSLLRDERATVAGVAGQVGYASEVAFAAAFKREVGTSPGAYRRGGPGTEAAAGPRSSQDFDSGTSRRDASSSKVMP